MNNHAENVEIIEEDTILKRITCYYKGFGFDYTKMFTLEEETIWNFSVFLFKKNLTLSISDGDWVNEDGKPKIFKVEDNTLYIKKIAIGYN